MPQIIKPTNLSLTWASGGDVLNPGDTKYATGWQVEIPPRQWFNYLDNRQDTALAHINQHGVAVWDAGTEYQANKSYVQGLTNGTIYRCVQTHTNQDPELDVGNVYWIVAFASAGDFYTKTETDGLYLAKSANGSDILNADSFRSNISVYSQAQTYTKTEVDAKTTVASALQTQQQTSKTVLLTPLGLSTALQGVNQTATANSLRQKFPGNFTVMGGSSSGSISEPYSLIFPTPFLNGCIAVTLTCIGGAGLSTDVSYAISNLSATGCTIYRIGLSTTVEPFYWIAIGT